MEEKSNMMRLWESALHDLDVRHPRRDSVPVLKLLDGDPPRLQVSVQMHASTVDDKPILELPISTVNLHIWPGLTLARQWIAAAWAGYLQHEALELVTVGERTERPLDPHQQPYATNPYNRGLRDGFPVDLGWDSLVDALSVVMNRNHAAALVARGGGA